MATLTDEERQQVDVESMLPDGSSATCCTNYALLIQRMLPGRVTVYGFANEENPTAEIVLEGLHPGGHDFAVVAGRYIVDPWLRLVAAYSDAFVFDLLDDKTSVMYGPPDCWTLMYPGGPVLKCN